MNSETSRIEAFSDGVFSIAATLLVLDLKPPAPNLPFWQGIAAQWPGYVSFLLSFLFIGIMWLNHHRLFSRMRHADDVLMTVNLLLLLGVAWIPYPTSLLARSVYSGNLREAAIFYNGSYIVLSVLFNLLLFTCTRRRLLDHQSAPVLYIGKRYLLGFLLYLLCFAITWWNVPLSLAINGGMAVFFLCAPSETEKPKREDS